MKSSTFGTVAAVLLSFSAMACSGAANPGDSAKTADGGTSGGDSGAQVDAGPQQGGDVNPYGVAYPTLGLGTKARNKTVAGGVFANLKFQGYPKGDPAEGMKPISMADFFDPEMRNYKIIIVAGTGNWCGYCVKEIQEVVKSIDQFKSEKIGFINAVMQSKSKKPAEVVDLDAWVSSYKNNFPTFLDPDGEQIGVYGKSYPVNFVLDARTMEILATILGSPSEGTLKRAGTYTKWVDANPPTTYTE